MSVGDEFVRAFEKELQDKERRLPPVQTLIETSRKNRLILKAKNSPVDYSITRFAKQLVENVNSFYNLDVSGDFLAKRIFLGWGWPLIEKTEFIDDMRLEIWDRLKGKKDTLDELLSGSHWDWAKTPRVRRNHYLILAAFYVCEKYEGDKYIKTQIGNKWYLDCNKGQYACLFSFNEGGPHGK